MRVRSCRKCFVCLWGGRFSQKELLTSLYDCRVERRIKTFHSFAWGCWVKRSSSVYGKQVSWNVNDRGVQGPDINKLFPVVSPRNAELWRHQDCPPPELQPNPKVCFGKHTTRLSQRCNASFFKIQNPRRFVPRTINE